MRFTSMILAAAVAVMAACSSQSETTAVSEPENVGTASQALVISEDSQLLDAANVPAGQNQYWVSSVGPGSWGPGDPYFEQQDSPGVCGITYIGGSFNGITTGDVDRVPKVYIGAGGYSGQQRYALNVQGDGNSYPKAKMHCVSTSKFTNTTNIASSKMDPAQIYANSSSTISYGISQDPNFLNIWGGTFGYLGSAAEKTATGPTFVSKVFRDNSKHFSKDAPASLALANRTVAYNTHAACGTVPYGLSDKCETDTFGWAHNRNANVGWRRTATDVIATVTNGVSARVQVAPYAYSSMFCFISGISGAWNTTGTYASVGPGLISGTTDLLVVGDGAEASATCVTLSQ